MRTLSDLGVGRGESYTLFTHMFFFGENFQFLYSCSWF